MLVQKNFKKYKKLLSLRHGRTTFLKMLKHISLETKAKSI